MSPEGKWVLSVGGCDGASGAEAQIKSDSEDLPRRFDLGPLPV